MQKIVIEGPRRLEGNISVHGAKNSVLPILAATILCQGECVIHNCPRLSDVEASLKILKHLGCRAKREGDCLIINASDIRRHDIPDTLMREMRSSIVFLGAIVSRLGRARLSLPGGCELGPRPIDLHLKALRQMGVIISEDHGFLDCSVDKNLCGVNITLLFPSVGATENILLAAVLAKGTTVISNAAREPEICDLADFLNKCGAKIRGAGEGTIVIDGVKRLCGAEHTIIPDRIEAITFMAAAGVTGGNLAVNNVIPEHLEPVLSMFEEAGCKIKTNKGRVLVCAPKELLPIKSIKTMPYPGFPTDAQAPLMAMTTRAQGTSVFVENVFESRYKHVGELTRLGANIKVEGRVAVVEGVKSLSGARVEAADLRGAASLVIAGLAAEGRTEITGTQYIDRGYENIEENLNLVGALIKRVE